MKIIRTHRQKKTQLSYIFLIVLGLINLSVPSCWKEILWNNSGCVFVVLQERLEINIVIFLMASLIIRQLSNNFTL